MTAGRTTVILAARPPRASDGALAPWRRRIGRGWTMNRARRLPGHVGSPEARGGVRSQVVGHGQRASLAIAAELDLPHATVVRILQRFAASDCLRLADPPEAGGTVRIAHGSLSARFADLSFPVG
jgi:hypothetical protein